LKERVFKATKKTTLSPHQVDQAGFLKWLKEYKKMLKIEQTAVEEL
jgi:hypothetical protein